MSAGIFGRVHFLRRQRRFALGEFPSPSIGCFEDFESQTLVFGGPERGWATIGVVYTYATLVAFEDYETSTLTSTILPVFGWAASGTATPPSITSNPTSIALPVGATASFSVIAINGIAPLTYQWRKAGVNLSNGGVVSGATTATLTLTGIGSGDFSTYDCVVSDAFSRTATTSTASLVDLIADWVARVVAAGGATPSAGTQTILTTFASGLVTDGIYSLFKGLNCFVPDSLIAATVPLIKGTGLSPWTNTNFVSGDLNVNGLKGNGSSKYLDTGLTPNTNFSSTNSGGITLYIAQPNQVPNAADIGDQGSAFNVNCMHLYGNYSDGNTYWDCFGAGTGRIFTANPLWAGYISGNRTASNANAVYIGRLSTVAHSTLVSGSGASDQPLGSRSLYCFATNGDSGPGSNGYSAKRLSFAAVHEGLTSGQSSNLKTRIETMRQSFGGGYFELTSTDAVADWVARVVANGGATPSGGTQTALSTFVSGLISDGLWTKVLTMNIIAPDSLTAALTPLVIGPGNDPWTNNNFVSGDLTVNGLVGNASNKYLDTGFIPGQYASAGLGLIIYSFTTPAAANNTPFGSYGPSSVNYSFVIPKYSDGLSYSGNAGTNQITVATRGPGFYASMRTNSTTHNLYYASSSTALTSIVSSATSSTGYSGFPMWCYQMNANGGSSGQWSNDRVSCFAVTKGMNSTDTANLYARIQTLRTSLGGGFV